MLNLILCFISAIVNGGVIDDKQSGGEPQPDNVTETFFEITPLGLGIILIAILIIGLIIGTTIILNYQKKKEEKNKQGKKE